MLGDGLSILGFVVARNIEPNGESINRATGLGLHKSNHGGGIKAT
jgi:hypothetical protein